MVMKTMLQFVLGSFVLVYVSVWGNLLLADFVHRYCVEASSERLLRLLARCVGRGFYHFRMKVSCFDESAHGVFAWRVEDSFHELRKLGFLLYDDNRGDWTPYGIYQYLLEQGRATAPMPVLRECSQ